MIYFFIDQLTKFIAKLGVYIFYLHNLNLTLKSESISNIHYLTKLTSACMSEIVNFYLYKLSQDIQHVQIDRQYISTIK